MIIGSGLLARTFHDAAKDRSDVVIYAAGVSNSQCRDVREFDRERNLLERSLQATDVLTCFVYFSTCSIADPESPDTPYVQHKLRMEQIVRAHPSHLILRLPHVAGRTPNPHTLLNYLYARIARGERFAVWRHARRNVIDCNDLRTLSLALIDSGVRGETLNVANVRDYAILEIVRTLERICRGHAVYDLVDRGAAYPIDVSRLLPFAEAAITFNESYLENVLRKYYG
ncbi:MAG: NAD-dependent epimerase/dehydratase family protein [Deltaproteobacteria bacterium]|nr:NAD-dependent epimerase/dehydratase family protein [Deltaproteobacteria bacterium]